MTVTSNSITILIISFRFDTDDVIWCRHKCVPWLIILIVFTSLTYWFEIMVYLKIMMPWLVIHLVYKMIDWFSGGGFRCSSAVCLFLDNFWWFLVILGPLEPRYDTISYSRCPMNDYFIFGTFHNVCTNEKFDSMYGWYGSNAQNMWKIAFLFVIFDDFWDLWCPDMTPYLTPDALWMIILSLGHSTMYVPMRNLIQCMGGMALMPKICENNLFSYFWWFLGPLEPNMTP